MEPHLTHLFMEVGDLQRGRWFWTDAIGLRLLDDRGVYIAVGGNGGFAIGIEHVAADRVSSQGPELTVRVDDVDAATLRLREMGVTVIEGPADQPWGARHAWLLEPRRTPHVDLLLAADDHGRECGCALTNAGSRLR